MTNPSRSTIVLWAVQFFGTAALAAFAYWWLSWPDERAWQVVASLFCAVIFAVVFAWLECTTLARFAQPESGIGSVFTRSLRRIPAFIFWMLILAAFAALLMRFSNIAPQMSTRAAQILHTSPRTVLTIAEWKIFALSCFLPALLLPLGAAIASNGFAVLSRSGLAAAFRPLRSARYWLACLIVLIIGIYLPYKLIHRIPIEPHPLKQEAWHMGFRLTFAYVLAISAWVFIARFIGERTTRIASDRPAV